MAELGWLPDWLASWADRNGDLRTAVPFFFLSLAWTLISWRSAPRLLWGHGAIVALLVLTELGQIFLPERHSGLMDILWGLVVLSAGGLAGLLYLFQKSQAQAQSQSQS